MVTGVGSPQAGANMSAPEKKPPTDNRRVSLNTHYIFLLFGCIDKFVSFTYSGGFSVLNLLGYINTIVN